jgi:hypothetical protein
MGGTDLQDKKCDINSKFCGKLLFIFVPEINLHHHERQMVDHVVIPRSFNKSFSVDCRKPKASMSG